MKKCKINHEEITFDKKYNKKYNCSSRPLAFKRQSVWYPSNLKLLHYYQHSKNQLNP